MSVIRRIQLIKMYLTLPRNVYARTYGESIYLFNQATWASVLIENAIIFKDVFSRTPTSIEQIINKTSENFQHPYSCVKSDLYELVIPLVAEGFLLCGGNDSDSQTKSNSEQVPIFRNHYERKEESESPEDLLYMYFHKNPTPFELDIDLTQACTERCIHCYASNYDTYSLDLELLKKTFGEFRAMGGLKVKLTGGECMLHQNFVDILDMARAHDFVISVLSNLTLCTDINKNAIKNADVAVVQTSLYGADAQTHDTITRRPGSFEQTMKAIKDLTKLGVQVQLHCPLMRQNVHAIEDIKKIGENIGVKTTFDAAIMTRANHDNNNLECALSDDMLYQYLKDQNIENISMGKDPVVPDAPICNIGIARICLSATGHYYPCSGCYGYVLGNCSQMTISEVWNGEKMTRLRSIRLNDLHKCRSCKLLSYCTICPARNYNATQSLFTPDPMLCRIAQIKHNLVSRETEA